MKMDTINFEKHKGRPLYEQIYHKIQEDILSGYLKKGDQLPSIRKAVSLFKVSKTSIENAYNQLLLDGLIISLPQKGYFIDVDETHVGLRQKMMQPTLQYEEENIRYDFRSQTMDKNAFDMTLWKKYLRDVLDHHQEITTYGDAQGERALRVALANYAYAMRGVLCHEHQLLIGSSFQSLLYILFGLFHKPFVMGMEEEGFLPLQTVCEDYGITTRYIASEDDGICMRELYESDVTLLYIHSVSSGKRHRPISRKKREELIEWASKRNAYIIEDDHNGELRYQTRLTPAMQGFDRNGHIIYIGSFSKLLLPSLRISYMVMQEDLAQCYLARKDNYNPTASKIEQLALAAYIRDGHLERHVKRLRKRYAIKSEMLYKLLTKYFKDIPIYLEESALQFVLPMTSSTDVDELIAKAKSKAICISKTSQQELVLSFAAISQNDMETAIQELYALYCELGNDK